MTMPLNDTERWDLQRFRADNERLRRKLEAVRKAAFDPEVISGLEHGVVGTTPDTYTGVSKDEALDIAVYALRDIRRVLDGAVPGDPAGTPHHGKETG